MSEEYPGISDLPDNEVELVADLAIAYSKSCLGTGPKVDREKILRTPLTVRQRDVLYRFMRGAEDLEGLMKRKKKK